MALLTSAHVALLGKVVRVPPSAVGQKRESRHRGRSPRHLPCQSDSVFRRVGRTPVEIPPRHYRGSAVRIGAISPVGTLSRSAATCRASVGEETVSVRTRSPEAPFLTACVASTALSSSRNADHVLIWPALLTTWGPVRVVQCQNGRLGKDVRCAQAGRGDAGCLRSSSVGPSWLSTSRPGG